LDDCGPGLGNEAKCFREQIAFILMPELFSRDGKGRAWDSSREKKQPVVEMLIGFISGEISDLQCNCFAFRGECDNVG
jgi:hypothetical protein